MKTCIFSPFCQYSHFDDSNVLNEQELLISTDTYLANRKLFSESSIHMSDVCGQSCPMWNLSLAQLRKNNLLNSNVFRSLTREKCNTFRKLYDRVMDNPSHALVYTSREFSSNDTADLLTYYGICLLWKYSLRSIMVYNLNFAKYVNDVSQTFGNSGDSDTSDRLLSLQDIINSRFESPYSNVLIVSGLDYVTFKGFKGEKLLEIISIREGSRLPLIIVTPELSNLMGEGQTFSLLTGVLRERKVTDV